MNSNLVNGNDRITTALLLAAGTGSRLFPLTKNSPKCLTLVNEKSILERLINNLKKQGFKRLVIITGHERECITDFLGSQSEGLTIEYVHSPLYKSTNNIYSLWLARHIMVEPFVLFESDLVLTSTKKVKYDVLVNGSTNINKIAIPKVDDVDLLYPALPAKRLLIPLQFWLFLPAYLFYFPNLSPLMPGYLVQEP